MKKLITAIIFIMPLVGCSDATRTVPILVIEERTISGDTPREALKVPSDYKNPTLPNPKDDPVLRDYEKNNFIGPMPQVKTIPLPPPRPANLGQKTK